MIDPVAFEVFGLSIRWYGIFMATAILLGTLLVLREARKRGIDDDIITDLALVTIPSGVIGARVYYVLFNWSYYQGDFLKMINIRGGGMAIHGAVIGGILAGYIFCKKKNLVFWDMADMAAPSLILGQAIGRWGNYTNHEAHGGPTDLPWGIMVDGVKVHPTFFYESVWNLMVLMVLLFYKDKKKFNGEVISLYFVLYSVGRFFIEGMRTDSLMLGPLRMAQVISLFFIVVFSGFIVYMRKRTQSIEKTV